MRKNIEYLVITGILLLVYSCNFSKTKDNKVIFSSSIVDFDLRNNEETILMSDFIDSVKMIWLKLPNDETIGRATRVCFDSSHIFILDRLQQKVFHFDINGTLLDELDKRGNGPGEYQSVYSCIARDNILYVFDKMDQKILLYDYSFKFIRAIHCEIWVENLFLLPDGSFLCFTPQYIYNAPNGLWKMSGEGKYMQQLYRDSEKYPLVSSEWDPFYITSLGGVGLKCPVKNEFYRYQDEKLTSVMKWIPHSKTALDFPGIENCVSVKEPFWNCPIFVDTDQWILGIWGEYNGGPSEIFSLYSKRQGKMHISSSLTVDVGDVLLMGNPISANLPNTMVTIVNDELFSNISGDSSLIKYKERLSDNQNLLLIYHFIEENTSHN
ncbi:6-bladed beta-propeller [Bacteroides oleiciplenus]|uniref:6-bladed beta-propeller n=1 Tax=Bacteroides oleiciplenus TaxID=626931 RepID=UPI0026DC229A|nr:6-bladed beta-propeller [Bacteroides oleiciplenus]